MSGPGGRGAAVPVAASRRTTGSEPDAGAGERRVGFVELVRRANAPPPAEQSVTFRLATAVAVLVGILACAAVGEIGTLTAVLAMAGTLAGMLFSYVTRQHPWQWVKLLLAAAVIGVFAAFVLEVVGAAHTGELSSIEVPLAGLFTWVQVIHSFDVPARRDLLFSLAAAGALLTVAAAQAVSVGFLGYVVVWLGASLVGLACSWRSMSGGGGPLPVRSVIVSGAVVLVIGTALLAVLPAPRATQSISLPASLTSYLPLPDPTAITGGGSQETEPAEKGSPAGRTGVGGYLGFSGALDTAVRASLGDEVVLRVRADRPGYFLGETYDTWNGQSWLQSRADQKTLQIPGGSPFDVADGFNMLAAQVPTTRTAGPTGLPAPSGPTWPAGAAANGPAAPTTSAPANVQTFYVEQPLANLLFATTDPEEVYFPSRSIVLGNDGSMRSSVAMTPGTVYTVVSQDDEQPPSALEKVPATRPPSALDADLQLPKPYVAVHALAVGIVRRAHAATPYGIVAALERWMAGHVEYTTDIPPLRPGQDAVDSFLFGTRRGYCEQISTSLTVMLRTLGIPAREAIGYVPGPYDPLSDLYEIQAKDAHAWVQVWFAGYGWQSFDPTAQVPLAPADPGAVLLHDIGGALLRLPLVPTGIALALVAAVWFARRELSARRRRPTGWAERLAAELERRGAAAGLRRRPVETISEYAARLARHGRFRSGSAVTGSLGAVAATIERAAYAPRPPDPAERAFAGSIVDSLHPVGRAGRFKPS